MDYLCDFVFVLATDRLRGAQENNIVQLQQQFGREGGFLVSG